MRDIFLDNYVQGGGGIKSLWGKKKFRQRIMGKIRNFAKGSEKIGILLKDQETMQIWQRVGNEKKLLRD